MRNIFSGLSHYANILIKEKAYICFHVNKLITIKDKQFKPFITAEQISNAVKRLADKINTDLEHEQPVFLVVLNGSFMFASDLLKEVNIPCEISFIKVASYHGTSSSGAVSELIGLTEDITDRTVVIIEDIVDTGITLEKLFTVLKRKNVKQIKVATALLKPASYKKEYNIDYAGLEIGNDFVVGYGLDYDGMGRNLKEIYVLA
ncbi:MAG: hypoxanthine phosphoribosyltransferase [Bacteroidetes bacterium]|nr:hypoxanthine phosphoribosyltransferase [Bacteroidota bacterium]